MLAGQEDERIQHQHQLMLKPTNLGEGILPVAAHACAMRLAELTVANEGVDINELILLAYAQDEDCSTVLDTLKRGDRQLPTSLRKRKISLADCAVDGQYLTHKGKVWVPTDKEIRLLILQQCHDEPAAGHPGREKTYELVNRHYFWPDLYNDVRRYVSHCHGCKRSKAFP